MKTISQFIAVVLMLPAIMLTLTGFPFVAIAWGNYGLAVLSITIIIVAIVSFRSITDEPNRNVLVNRNRRTGFRRNNIPNRRPKPLFVRDILLLNRGSNRKPNQ